MTTNSSLCHPLVHGGTSAGPAPGTHAAEAGEDPAWTAGTTSRVFPGVRASVPRARAFIREVLDGFPGVETAELLACELVTNSVLHSVAGLPGHTFMVRVTADPGHWARVEVSDPGPLPEPGLPAVPAALLDESGRGCLIVRELADSSDRDGHGLAWFRLDWTGGMPC